MAEFDLSSLADAPAVFAAMGAGSITADQAQTRMAQLQGAAVAKAALSAKGKPKGDDKPAKPKAPPAVSRAFFREKAVSLECEVGGTPMLALPKEFAAGLLDPKKGEKGGSLGWFTPVRCTAKIDGVPVTLTGQISLQIVNSKLLDI